MNEKTYNCDKCFCKSYKTLNGLLKHKNKIHENDQPITYNCSKCNKNFNCRQHRWRHEKICNNTGNLHLMNEQIKILSNKINQLENKSNIINNNSNNTINNTINNIVINHSPGTEPINHLSIEKQKEIMNRFQKNLRFF